MSLGDGWLTIPEDDIRRAKLKERLFHGLLLVASSLGIVALVFLFADVIYEGTSGMLEFGIGPLEFLTRTSSARPEEAGFLAAIIASFWLLVLTAIFSFFIGVGCAIYLVEYAPDNRTTRLIEANLSNLAGVPSIVYGLLVLAAVVNGIGVGAVVMSGAIALALLVMPIIIVASIEALRAVPDGIRDGSAATGATRWQTIREVVLPAAMPGIITGTILALARAIGETAPLIMVGALLHARRVPGPIDYFSAMPTQIYNWTFLADPRFNALAALGIVVLLVVLLGMHGIAVYLRKRYETEM